ncbi:MAG: hypothetical protein M1819_006445 [Sarea resinae]|nr:MAG: hypothetical protein M1819_006445 [Sarea resinae]
MAETPNQRDLVASNAAYAANFKDGDLPTPPSKKYSVVTCMDSRIFPSVAFGIPIGSAHIIRNAGGSASEALRSILISQHMLGTTEVIVIKHTGCGMLTFSNADARAQIAKDLGGDNTSVKKLDNVDFLPFTDLEEEVRKDVRFLRESELLVHGVVVSGWIYEVETGKVKKVDV